jgi:hypothetical protein
MRVALAFRGGLGLLDPNSGTLGNLEATVTGVPAGQLTTISLQVLGGTLQPITTTPTAARTLGKPGSCAPQGQKMICTVGSDGTLRFKVQGVPVSATAEVEVPGHVEDPDMSNNHDSLLLGIL